jgi:hypothetical protein
VDDGFAHADEVSLARIILGMSVCYSSNLPTNVNSYKF